MNTHDTPPTDELLSHTLAFCEDCLNRQDFSAAWQALCRAVSLAPNRADVLSHRGRLAMFLRDTQTAQRDYAAAVKLDPLCSSAWSGLARYHAQQGDLTEAEAAADRALGIDPTDEEAAQAKAEIQVKPVPAPGPQVSTRTLEHPLVHTPKQKLRLLQVNTYYSWALDAIYMKNPGIGGASFASQSRAILESGFSAIHCLTPGLEAIGYETLFVVANNWQSQNRWCEEHDIRAEESGDWMGTILKKQIEVFRPDILFCSDVPRFDAGFLASLTNKPKLVAGWHASDLPESTSLVGYDLILSAISGVREHAQRIGAKASEDFMPGFPVWLYEKVKHVVPHYDVVFSGQWTLDQHARRSALLDSLAQAAEKPSANFTFKPFLSGDRARFTPAIARCAAPGVFGLEMHMALRQGRIGFDARGGLSGVTAGRKLDIAGCETANMRVIETIGSGVFLLTEQMANLGRWFQPGLEMETYVDEKELFEKIRYFVSHPADREVIAERGRIRCHTIFSSTATSLRLDAILRQHLVPPVGTDDHDAAGEILGRSDASSRLSGSGQKSYAGDQSLQTSSFTTREGSAEMPNTLDAVRRKALSQRFGHWELEFFGCRIFCRDLLSFYMATKDIFVHRIYDFTAVGPNPVVIDGGGHIGLFSLYAKLRYPGASVTVFEPDPESLEFLKKNLAVNGLHDVRVVESGLFRHDGETQFSSDHSDGGTMFSGERAQRIRLTRLSSFITGPVDCLKLNIEGAELDVLREVEPKLHLVREVIIEYHGFSEIGQRLHQILALLDRNGFRYLVHDFDSETNPATKPPFRIEVDTRFFLLIYGRRILPASTASTKVPLDFSCSTQPVSRVFGLDRGTPIDRFYIETFLEKHRSWVRGRVLEIGGNDYTKQFDGGVTRSEVLNAVPSPVATIVGDLATGENIPDAAFDCIILTQTIQMIYDIKTVLQHAARALKPGGVLLLTASGISQISRYDMDRWGEFWRFTDLCLKRLLSEAFPADAIQVKAHGNVAVAKAFLDGLAQQDIPAEILSQDDPDYQVVLTAVAQRPGPASAPAVVVAKPAAVASAVLPAPMILLYHRVTRLSVDAQLLAVTPDNFAAQLDHLAHNFRVVTLRALLDEVRRGEYRPDTVALTFDDGYLDVLREAVPLLEKYRMPATVFVTSGRVGSDREFWWDALERVFLTNTSLPEALSINDEGKDRTWDLTTPRGRLSACDDLAGVLRVKAPEEIDAFVETLLKWAGLRPEGRVTHRVVTADQLREMARSPVIEIGSHTISHCRLSSLPPDRQRHELIESKRQLEALVQRPVSLFSYPFGSTEDFTADTMKLVVAAGYEAALANTQDMVRPPVNLLTVPRRLVRNWSGNEFAGWLRDPDKGRLLTQTLSTRAATLTTGLCAVTGNRRD